MKKKSLKTKFLLSILAILLSLSLIILFTRKLDEIHETVISYLDHRWFVNAMQEEGGK